MIDRIDSNADLWTGETRKEYVLLDYSDGRPLSIYNVASKSFIVIEVKREELEEIYRRMIAAGVPVKYPSEYGLRVHPPGARKRRKHR